MRDKLLSMLKCSYCDSGFVLGSGSMINGYLRCGCGEYKIKDGILLLKEQGLELKFWTRKVYGLVLWLQKIFYLNFYQSMRLMYWMSFGSEKLWFQ